MEEQSLAKGIFNLMMGIMKNQLKLAAFRLGGGTKDETGKTIDSEPYKYFKEQTMNHFYEATKRFYQEGVAIGLFERCPCGANLRKGWKDCPDCAGSGYRDKK